MRYPQPVLEQPPSSSTRIYPCLNFRSWSHDAQPALYKVYVDRLPSSLSSHLPCGLSIMSQGRSFPIGLEYASKWLVEPATVQFEVHRVLFPTAAAINNVFKGLYALFFGKLACLIARFNLVVVSFRCVLVENAFVGPLMSCPGNHFLATSFEGSAKTSALKYQVFVA
ncbi:hypothetical protein BDW71DRAFT_66101 [Aspergillus fruticulosus]